MLRHLLRERPLRIAGREVGADAIEAVVARIDEVTNEPQDIIEREPLQLDTEIADLDRLLAWDGPLGAVADQELDALDFRLDQKCDGCVFNVHCLPESAGSVASS